MLFYFIKFSIQLIIESMFCKLEKVLLSMDYFRPLKGCYLGHFTL